jgi:hypothetical protein
MSVMALGSHRERGGGARFVLTPKFRNYSRSERELFELMPRNGSKISSKDLTDLRHRKFDWDIMNPRNAVAVTMHSLRIKVERNREPFSIYKTKQCGPYPVEFWIGEIREDREKFLKGLDQKQRSDQKLRA